MSSKNIILFIKFSYTDILGKKINKKEEVNLPPLFKIYKILTFKDQ